MGLVGWFALAGCTAGPIDSLPPPRPLGADLGAGPAGAPAGAVTDAPTSRPVPSEPTGELTLRQALALALAGNPELAGFSWAVRMAEADRIQAALPPNPEFEAEFENFAGTGEFRGTRALETTVALGQVVELGGKRGARMRLAGWDYEAKRLAVLTDVTKQFIGVLALQGQLAFARRGLDLARQTRQAVARRVGAGKAVATEESKAAVAVASAQIAVRRTERKLKAAGSSLAATWGGRGAKFTRAIGQLGEPGPLPPMGPLIAKLAQNPDVARWSAEIARHRSAVEAERANGVPDVEVGVGYRHFRETADNDRAMLVTVAIPLPIFDRNQSGVRKASFALLKARADQRAAEVRARADLEAAWQELAASHEEAVSLRDEVLPAARASYEAAGKLFAAGKTDYLDMLDAQQTLMDATAQHVDALAAYHQALADVEGLIGQRLDTTEETVPITLSEESPHAEQQ